MKPNIHKLNGFIYVTSDEEIKYDDYISDRYFVWQWKDNRSLLGTKKVILTNDPLITTIQKLTPEEEAYCKTVDSVGVVKWDGFSDWYSNNAYQLQLPKQETIEDLVKDYEKEYIHSEIYKEGVIAGYNYAVKTLYTEEEVLAMLLIKHDGLTAEYVLQQFNQNKKK